MTVTRSANQRERVERSKDIALGMECKQPPKMCQTSELLPKHLVGISLDINKMTKEGGYGRRENHWVYVEIFRYDFAYAVNTWF